MCTLRHILPQGVMTTFNKATKDGVLEWVNHMHTMCVW